MKNKYSTSKFILFGSLTVASMTIALIYFYLASPNVVTSEWGGPEQFGQFGDMIGGVLNPLLGFVTIIILIRTLSHETAKSADDRENIKELNRERKCHKLSESITHLEASLKNEMHESMLFADADDDIDHRQTFIQRYFNSDESESLKVIRAAELRKMMSHINHYYDKDHEPTESEINKLFTRQSMNYWMLFKLKILIGDIEKCYLLLIKNEISGIFRHKASMEYNHFMSKMLMKMLVSEDQLDIVEANCRSLMEGFNRTSL